MLGSIKVGEAEDVSISLPIHTIVGGRLDISENKAMKLLITKLISLLIIGFAGSSYSQGFE
jgi:hypothetical protein